MAHKQKNHINLCRYNRALTQIQVDLIQRCVESKLFTLTVHRVALDVGKQTAKMSHFSTLHTHTATEVNTDCGNVILTV